jgi:hypothetical protein
MNDTTLLNSKKIEVGTKTTKTVIDYSAAVKDETPQLFELRIFKAQRDGLSSVEANPDVIDFYNPDGLGGSEYFIFRNIRVYKEGVKTSVEAQEKLQSQERLHGLPYRFEGLTQ